MAHHSNSLFYRLRCQRTRTPHTISSHPISPALFSPHPISPHPISSHPISHPQTSTEWVAELVAKSTPHANAMMKNCHAVFKLCGTMLQPLFDANNEGRDYCLQVTRIKGSPLYANPRFGFCSKVHAATVPSLLTVSVRLFDFSLHGPPCTESGPGG